MKLNEFVNVVKQTCTCKKYTDYDFKVVSKEKVDKDCIIFKEWVIGGKMASWTGSESRPAEPEPKFKDLNNLLKQICPNITYLQYEDLSEIFETSEYTENDYYGVVYEHRIEYVKITDLYNKLIELQLI